jgi:aspartyl-tRNA(Asn)/glutamyl-tRNA(Gln) amidotransferase subunit C
MEKAMLTKEELEKLSRLSKIRFKPEDAEDFCRKLKGVMAMIDTLKDVDVEGVEPLTSVVDASARMRKDEVTEKNIDTQLFSNAPGSTRDMAREIKCFVVPKMVE